ncbi:hypothetical protein Tco_0079814 [Tanacetum coccineum]
MTVPSTIKEKTCKKNDVKARSLLLMALPNEHQLTFDQYVDAQSMFAAIKARFRGNEATKKTQKALLKQQYENFSASSSESLDSIFNRLQRLVSRLAILGLDDLYNNFKIVEQKVKKSAGANNDDKNLAFVTTSGASNTNNINTVILEVSIVTTKVNTASTEICTASFKNGFKVQNGNTSMRARMFYQRNWKESSFDGSNHVGYDKSKLKIKRCLLKKAMCAIDGAGFDWSDMAEEEIQANMALMAFSDSELHTKEFSYLEDFKIVKYREHEVRFSREIALLKRSVGSKEYQLGLLRTELEKVKQEKEGVDFKIAKFDKSAKDLVSFKEGRACVQGYGTETARKSLMLFVKNSSNETKKNSDAPLIEEWVSDNEDEVESPLVVKKKTVFPTVAKIEFVRPKQNEKPVRKQLNMQRCIDHKD